MMKDYMRDILGLCWRNKGLYTAYVALFNL